MAMERSTVLSRPKSHAGRRRIVTVPSALTSRSGIGGFRSHPRRSGGGCKPDVPPRAHTTLQKPISRSLSWTIFVRLRIHAGLPPVMGATTAIRRATQNTVIRFQTTEESRVECVLPCRHERMRAGHLHPHSRSTKAPASSNQRGPSHAFGPRTQAAPLPVVGLIHNRASATAASLNITITVTTTVKRAT